MNVDRADLAVFVYNVAVVTSGGYIAITFGIEDPIAMLPIAIGVGLAWTIYYHVRMASLLEDIRTGELIPDDDPRDEADPDGEPDAGPDGEDVPDEDERRGADPPWS